MLGPIPSGPFGPIPGNVPGLECAVWLARGSKGEPQKLIIDPWLVPGHVQRDQ